MNQLNFDIDEIHYVKFYKDRTFLGTKPKIRLNYADYQTYSFNLLSMEIMFSDLMK